MKITTSHFGWTKNTYALGCGLCLYTHPTELSLHFEFLCWHGDLWIEF